MRLWERAHMKINTEQHLRILQKKFKWSILPPLVFSYLAEWSYTESKYGIFIALWIKYPFSFKLFRILLFENSKDWTGKLEAWGWDLVLWPTTNSGLWHSSLRAPCRHLDNLSLLKECRHLNGSRTGFFKLHICPGVIDTYISNTITLIVQSYSLPHYIIQQYQKSYATTVCWRQRDMLARESDIRFWCLSLASGCILCFTPWLPLLSVYLGW